MLPQVAEYFEQFDPAEIEFLYEIRDLILSVHPAIEERYSYQVPFYYFQKPLCYLVFNKKRQRFVVGFTAGFTMEDPENLLIAEENQNTIKHLVLSPQDPKLVHIIPLYIQLAIQALKTNSHN